MSMFTLVARWHEAMGLPIGDQKFSHVDFKERRAALIVEEIVEALGALGCKVRLTYEVQGQIHTTMTTGSPESAPDFLDGCLDAVWVLLGSLVELGWDADGAWQEIVRSNFSKEPRRVDSNGKLEKGPNFSPPQLARFIRP